MNFHKVGKCAALMACALGSAAQAATLYVHEGAANPVTEGWSAHTGTGGGTTASAVYNDAGSGFDAWAVDDNSTAYDTGRYYYENLTLREIGEVLGVTESRVSQLHTKAVLRLKARLQSEVEA